MNVSWYHLESPLMSSLSTQPNVRHSRNHSVVSRLDIPDPYPLTWSHLVAEVDLQESWAARSSQPRSGGCFMMLPLCYLTVSSLPWENRHEKACWQWAIVYLVWMFGAGEASFRVNNNSVLADRRIPWDCTISRELILYMHWLIVDTKPRVVHLPQIGCSDSIA